MKKPPSYRLHAASGQARVTLNGRTYYLGAYNTAASRKRYDRLIAEWLSSGRSATFGVGDDQLTIIELLSDYAAHCKVYYGDGKNSELWRVLNAAEPLKKLYKTLPAIEFGSLQFKAVRQAMIELNWARTTINANAKRLVRMFKWAASEGKLPPSIYEALRLIPSLKAGRTTAREPAPIKPVSDVVVNETCKHLTPVLADMVRLQLLLGCRPSEVCSLTPAMIDRSKSVWTACLSRHKTRHHGRERILYFGPQAQAIVTRYLLRAENDCLFRPCDSDRIRNALRREQRVTPLNEGNRAGYNTLTRSGTKPKQMPGVSYSTIAYSKAIERICKKHGIEHWSPNQLRHSRATYIRKTYGLEAAQVILGHSQANVTQIYAERDTSLAIEIQTKIG